MISDYPRRITCHVMLFNIYSMMEQSLSDVLEMMEEDELPTTQTLGIYVDLIHTFMRTAIDTREVKKQNTAVDHEETEHPEIIRIAQADFDEILAELKEEVISLMERCYRECMSPPEIGGYFEDVRRNGREVHEKIKWNRQKLGRLIHELTMIYPEMADPKAVTGDKYIVSVDMCKYGLISSTRDLDELFTLNRKIQEAIHQAIIDCGADLTTTIVVPTGDGSIVPFDRLNHALTFAVKLAEASESISAEIRALKYRRYFRIGIAAGKIKYIPYSCTGSPALGAHLAGTAIATAVRLQTAAPENGIYVEAKIVDDALRGRSPFNFGEPLDVPVKEHEKELGTIKARLLRRNAPDGAGRR